MDVSRRSVTSSAYNITANIVQIIVNFGRSVALARLLGPDIFGVFVFASSIVDLSQVLSDFGLKSAFLKQATESDQREAAKVHFTLTALLSAFWAILMIAGVALFAPPEIRWVFWFLTCTAFVFRLTHTPRIMLTSRVEFRRLALLEIISSIIGAVIAIGLAWYGFGLLSLLVPKAVTLLIAVVIFYVIRPVWRPQLGWNRPLVRQFLSFGSRVYVSQILLQALDRLDDIWTGAVLGATSLGYYSRAYKFATYPRIILSKPLSSVAEGTYAQLKNNRKQLSQAFFRVNALLVRSNFMLSGILILIAPEFIRIVLGVKWMPMLEAFRLMLLYTLLDPIKLTVANVITISGAPEKVRLARFLQLIVMIVGLITLGQAFGISGVALAVNLMLVVGISVLLWQVREFVDFSLIKLFAAPALALFIGLLLARLSITIPGVLGSDWRTAGVKIIVFIVVYTGLLTLLERRNILMLFGMLRHLRVSLKPDQNERLE